MGAHHLQDASRRSFGTVLRRAVLAIIFGLCFCTPSAAATTDWSPETQQAHFANIDAALQQWLVDPDAHRLWRDAVQNASAPSRLGPSLLQAAGRQERQVEELLQSPGLSIPVWLSADSPVMASIRLAIAEARLLESRYDEALTWTEDLAASDVYSPALLHYVRAVALRATVEDQPAGEELSTLEQLSPKEGTAALGTARWWLIQSMLRRAEEPSGPLPVVSRRMQDVSRRLLLVQADKETQNRQQRVLDELDELIKQLEKQLQQQQQKQAAGSLGGASAPSSPAEESLPGELKGPGEVDRKRLVSGDAWGALPPAERERLKQAITRDLPPHYRTLVEDYFRTLADEPAPESP